MCQTSMSLLNQGIKKNTIYHVRIDIKIVSTPFFARIFNVSQTTHAIVTTLNIFWNQQVLGKPLHLFLNNNFFFQNDLS
jgi:hypothetical protein